MQSRFDQLVREQLATMEKLLFIQGEMERCQQLQTLLQDDEMIQEVESQISEMRQQLHNIQKTFERQTEEVIKTYQLEHI
ncbi:YgaB family protein [Bacillus alveayuensis]|uniref:YgaB family protein n=1 Tax=Aeribacillus alveayuensis TaxID=279215 RepID=UPI0005CD8AC8|nr:YgaB family protein [Bacillus alveayuensis]